ncbi:MAG: epoxyqueuosine reductase QueH [Dictyoglomaceae bacterium]|nr:epoxyqueuosine reductase QueH [Dictyoglomaceae bacterium]
MKDEILLHICCSNCIPYPLKSMREEGYKVKGFWYNPNIHPYQEYKLRLEALKIFSEYQSLDIIYEDDYDLEGFLREVVFRENNRCPVCYYIRLKKTAQKAKELGFERFSTTLLVSPYQKHELIKNIGELLAEEFNLEFFYKDFRVGYREGINIVRELNLYRQKYCGCIYSEKERFRKGVKI